MGLLLKNINKYYYYKKSNQNHALKGVSLNIDDGEFVAVVGKSGAGKSTLLHILACIDCFESGSYFFNETKTETLSDAKKSHLRNEQIGIVLQGLGLIEGYTVLENVMTPLHFSGVKSKNKRQELAMQALQRVGILKLAKSKVNKISGGQRQRVAIARAIVNSPSVLLADEPTGALDRETATEIMSVFKDLNSMGMTVVVVTHDEKVAEYCQRQIVIADGKIVSDKMY